MDISMPGLSGAEATDLLKQACPPVKVLALTVHQDRGYLRQLLPAADRQAGRLHHNRAARYNQQGAVPTLTFPDKMLTRCRRPSLLPCRSLPRGSSNRAIASS